MRNLKISTVLLLLGLVSVSQAIRCYQCSYIEDVNDRRFNQDCVDKIGAGTVELEEGAACVKAIGHHGPNRFTLRMAFRPASIYQQNKITLPSGQGSITCHAANITVDRIGGRIVNSLDVCEVCNNEDACNGTSRLSSLNVFSFSLSFLCVLWGLYRN